MADRKTINIDIMGIGKRTESTINFVIVIVIIAVFLVLSLIFGALCIIFPGLTEMSTDIIRGHPLRFVAYFILSLISFLVLISIFKGTGKFLSSFLTIFAL